MTEDGDYSGLTIVRRCALHQQAEDYALVLIAIGIGSKIIRQGEFSTVFVAYEDAGHAHRELAAYDRENQTKPAPAQPRAVAALRPDAALIYWGLLFFFFAAIHGDFFSVDWVGIGAMQTGQLLAGEWWRAFTALFLHVSLLHLLGNLVFGTIFLLLLGQVAGIGVATLSLILAGGAGNYFNALLIQSADHTSIGASTAIFAALGTLTALQQMWRKDRPLRTLRGWIPLAGGVTLLGFLGFSGVNTDIAAHVWGFICGLAFGAILGLWRHEWMLDRRLQRDGLVIGGALAVLAWIAAL